jgi:hypothetical protein
MEVKKLMEELEIDVIPPYMIKSKVSIITECLFLISINISALCSMLEYKFVKFINKISS